MDTGQIQGTPSVSKKVKYISINWSLSGNELIVLQFLLIMYILSCHDVWEEIQRTSEIGFFRTEHILEAHALQRGRDIEHRAMREARQLQLESWPPEQATQESGPATSPVGSLDESLLQPGQPVTCGSLFQLLK